MDTPKPGLVVVVAVCVFVGLFIYIQLMPLAILLLGECSCGLDTILAASYLTTVYLLFLILWFGD